MRNNLVVAVLLVATVAACNDTTAPTAAPHVANISNINVTAHGAVGDTVKVSFNYSTVACDTGVVVEARRVDGGLRFTVTSWPTNQVCTFALTSIVSPPPVGYVVNPPHVSPLRLVFTQPSGTDSVRVVEP